LAEINCRRLLDRHRPEAEEFLNPFPQVVNRFVPSGLPTPEGFHMEPQFSGEFSGRFSEFKAVFFDQLNQGKGPWSVKKATNEGSLPSGPPRAGFPNRSWPKYAISRGWQAQVG
jgi:hypothetical protein